MFEKLKDRMARGSWEIAEAERRMCAEVGAHAFYRESATVVIGVFAAIFGGIGVFIAKAVALDWVAVQPWATFDVQAVNTLTDVATLFAILGVSVAVILRYYKRVGKRHRQVIKEVAKATDPKGW